MDDINDIVSFKSGGSSEPAVEAKAEPVQPVAEAAPKGEPEKAAATPAAVERDESGRFKAKAGEPAQEPQTEVKPEPAKPAGQLAALLAERAKRQEAEQRQAALEQEIAALKSGQTEKPDVFTDPEGTVQRLVDQKIAPVKQRFFAMSVQAAEKQYGAEFEAAAEQFMALAEANPGLIQQLKDSEDPGEFVYQTGTNTPEFRQAQAKKASEALSAKDTEIAALKAEVEALKNAQQSRNAVPESLNRQPSGAVPARESDSDINSIVRFKTG
jgi:hypothetical protein